LVEGLIKRIHIIFALPMTIDGTVTYIDLEGGFWAIIGLNGQKLLPINELPETFLEDGLAVRVEVEPVEVMTFFQWGETVELHHIERR
jgi:hypothetical protein